jgi:dipeptidyl aminopeptidase/acylaminoacyl peptidase
MNGEPHVRRWHDQRWLIDNIIRANGMEWDQPRLLSLNAALGPESSADVAAIRQRVQKLADVAPAFAAAAARREAKARAAEEAGAAVTARENYYMAANYWASAQWSLDENNAQNLSYNQRKRECFQAYARLADHRIVESWVPFQGKALPGWLHLPPGYREGRLPAVVSIPGMDGFKERSVTLYGDPWLSRGIAVLALEGPGQYESAVLGINVTMQGWSETGRAAFDWLSQRPEIDPERIGITGRSFGTFFSTIALASEPRFRAGCIMSPCLEPGCHTIFEEASPTYKKRFMYMSGITDETVFDRFRQTLTWEGHAERIRSPFLCIAGESDELSPLPHVERMIGTLKAPKLLVVYQDSRHSVGGVPAANLGPAPNTLLTDWMADRLNGKPFASERWFVDAAGRVTKTPL